MHTKIFLPIVFIFRLVAGNVCAWVFVYMTHFSVLKRYRINDNQIIIGTASVQILFSKCHFPLMETETPGLYFRKEREYLWKKPIKIRKISVVT
jgi:hypothetical protein